MQAREVIVIVATLGLVLTVGTLTTMCSQNTFAQNSNTGSANGAGGANSGAGVASSGTGGYNSNGGVAGSSGAVPGVDRHLFCDGIGMITPICK